MATLNVTEFAKLSMDAQGRVCPVPNWDADTVVQNVTYTTAAASSAFAATTRFIRVLASADAYIVVGSAPVATASNGTLLEANVESYFGVQGDGVQKISAYDGTS